MPFEEIKTIKLYGNRCTVTVSGHLRIPKDTYTSHTMKNHVQLLFDKELGMVGIKPTNVGYSLHPTRGVVMEFTATPLLQYLSVGRHNIEWSEEHQMFLVKSDV